MRKQKPLVSVLLPVHNSGNFLREALESLRIQTHKNIEIIAIDDRSSDDSFKILRLIKKKDKRLRIYRNVKRYGIVLTLNRLLRRAKGDYIAFMDAKDISHNERMRKQLKFLLANPEVVALGTQCTFVKKKGRTIEKSKFPRENSQIYTSPLHGLSMQFETVMIRKNLLPKDVLKFDTNSSPFIYSDFLIKLSPYGKLANLGNYLHFHRNHPKIYWDSIKIHIFSYLKLWLKSIANYDYNPSLRSLFRPLIKPI